MHLRSLVPTAAIAVAAVALSRAALGLPTALGAPAPRLRDTADRAAAAGSGHVADGRFHNTLPDEVVTRGTLLAVLRAMLTRGSIGRPAAPVPLAADPAPATPAPLALTWYGHSSVLLEVDGHRVLADPVWGERVSPSPTIGPRRLHPAPVPLSALPPVDAVVLSHDHYDHLDLPTVRALLHAGEAPFVVPLGLGNHLRRWGVPDARVVELDWDESVQVGGLALTCTEARHFSGRGLRRNTTLWSSWVVTGPAHRAFFGGDTGYTPAFADLGRAYGPFDLTVLPIGAYSERWPSIHMNPEEAVQAHRDLTSDHPALLMPIHWATFNLGFHPWMEPVQRLRAAAQAAGVRIAVPRPGERLDATAAALPTDWWTAVG
ncbi:MAG: MBL fold metallo-hydrolase [Pseudonocardia sp.]|nr:MBL fold metallo-hydrolase [Pseudonocardia sp.]